MGNKDSENYAIILDTCLVSEYISKSDSDLFLDIYTTSIAFEAPLFITSLSFYEYFRNVKNSEEIRHKMIDLERMFHGTAHIIGIGDNYLKYFEPEYWLEKEIIDYDEFKEFIHHLSIDIKVSLSPIIGSIFIAITLTIFIFESIYQKSKETNKILSTLIYLFTDKRVKTSIDEIVYDYMKENNGITELEKLKSLISDLIIEIEKETKLQLLEYLPQQIFDSSKLKKTLKTIRRLSDLEIQEYEKMFSLKSTSDFLESCFHLIFNRQDFEDILYIGMKYMYMNSPLNNGKLSFNDLIDLSNICFINRIPSMKVIYSTRDKRWRNFIEQNVDKNQALWSCLIIGNEGLFDK